MICSEAELGLSEESIASWCWARASRVGADFAACLPYPDVLFEVTTTSNRPTHCLNLRHC